jgi:hypothetical protein
MIQKLKKKLRVGPEWLPLLLPLGLFIFFGWLFFDGINNSEFKEWYSTPISDMQIKDILIIGLIVAWFGRNSCKCKNDK